MNITKCFTSEMQMQEEGSRGGAGIAERNQSCILYDRPKDFDLSCRSTETGEM